MLSWEDMWEHIFDFIIKMASEIPDSHEEPAADPDSRAEELISSAALRSALIAGPLSLPPGPLGVVTILPELTTIWRLQAQLVADLAKVYGQTLL